MLNEWNIETNYIWANANISEINYKEIKNVIIFDLDYTLIKTKSKKKFPINKNDWEFLYPNIPKKISNLNLSGSLIGIVSNQKGLKTMEQKDDWIDKIKQINKIIKINFVFASLMDDRFRKPLPDSFNFIKNKYIQIDWKELLNNKKIYYIGDAFGRKNDFSDTDVKYALNNKLKFKTPELFFKTNMEIGKTGSITYPIINYFTIKEQNKLFDELDDIIKTHKKILIMAIGLPASGKSFLRKELLKKYTNFVYFNKDDIQNNIQSKILINKLSPNYDFIIDDNTNLNKLDRNNKLIKFDEYYKVGIWFNYELDICFHLNWLRMYWFGIKLLPKVSYYTLKKSFDNTDIDVGFDKFIKIDKVFRELNLDDKIKYYF